MFVSRVLSLTVARQIEFGIVFLFLVSIIAFLFWSSNVWLRQQVLEGQGLPQWLKAPLLAKQQGILDNLNAGIMQLQLEIVQFRRAQKKGPTWADQLTAARKTRKKTGVPVSISESLETKWSEIDLLRSRSSQISFDAMEDLFTELKAELAKKPADKVEQLDQIHSQFNGIAKYSQEKTEAMADALYAERDFQFPPEGVLRPTTLGNVAELHRRYAWSRYRIDLEVFWPSLQKALTADSSFAARLEDARIKLDFAVSMTFVAGFVTMITFFVVPWYPLCLAATFAGAAFTYMFYRVGLQNYHGYGQLLRSAVDLYRFDLLRQMHLPLPLDSKSERQLWTDLAIKASTPESERAVTFTYLHDQSSIAKPVPLAVPPRFE